MTTLRWTFDKTLSDSSGTYVNILRREVSLHPREIREEMRPFFELPTLFRVSREHGMTTSLRGIVNSLSMRNRSLEIGISVGTTIQTLALENIQQVGVAIWRVNDKLDAIQLIVKTATARAYLQTGGEHVFNFITTNCNAKATKAAAHEVATIFNSSLHIASDSNAKTLQFQREDRLP